MMKQRSAKALSACMLTFLLLGSTSHAGPPQKERSDRLAGPATDDTYRPILINNIFNYYGNNGDGSYNKFTPANEGFEFVKGTGKTVIYEDGVVWGGFHKGRSTPKVGGSVYKHGLQAGPLLTAGTATTDPVPADASDGRYHIFRVRPDINPHAPLDDAVRARIQSSELKYIGRYESVGITDIYNQYISDWNTWPADQGAPYTDVDRNGVYDPAVDIPGVPQSDQTLWYVANDESVTRCASLGQSPPIGLEIQRTIWGYKRQGPLGYTILTSTLLINKSGVKVDSMFITQWSDPDLGDPNDDLVGCDTTRDLGYVYNAQARDAMFGTSVPAAGYVLLQGPLVHGAPADTAIFRLRRRSGVKNLRMSAFLPLVLGFQGMEDPLPNPGDDVQWYRAMQGLSPLNGDAILDPTTNQPAKLMCPGDPVSGSGWRDEQVAMGPSDRRLAMSAGPFTMADGDTQEIVVATLAAPGADYLSSITVLRSYTDQVQRGYDNLLQAPQGPPPPLVDVVALEGEIALNWGDPATVGDETSYSSQGYTFEGYKIFELPAATFDPNTALMLAEWDKKNGITTIRDTLRLFDASGDAYDLIVFPPEQGTDNGINRSIAFDRDPMTGKNFVKGSRYYFAVQAWGHAGNVAILGVSHSIPGDPTIVTAIPQSTLPGVRYPANLGDTLAVAHSAGVSDGSVLATVVNPSLLNGSTYNVIFGDSAGSPVWNLLRMRGAVTDTLVRNQKDQGGGPEGAVMVDGIEFRVSGPPSNFKNFLVTSNALGALDPPEAGAFAFNSSGFPLGPPLPAGTDRPYGPRQQVALAGFGGSYWGIHTGMNDPAMDVTYPFFVSRVTQGRSTFPFVVPYDFEIRFTAAGGQALFASDYGEATDKLVHVPFELWNIGINTPTDASDDYRLFPNILDVDGNGSFNLLSQAGVDTVDNAGGGADHGISGGTNDPFTDWIFWVKPTDTTPGQAGYNAIVAGTQAAITAGTNARLAAGSDREIMRRMVLVGANFGDVSDPGAYLQQMPETGTVFRIVTTKPNSAADVFTLTAPLTRQDLALAKKDVGRVNIYPNPCFASPLDPDKSKHFVTFTHLPTDATIRIFNLGGSLVRTMVKNNGDSQFFTWDLKNDKGRPVAAGMYIIHVDMPGLKTSKVLKFGLVP